VAILYTQAAFMKLFLVSSKILNITVTNEKAIKKTLHCQFFHIHANFTDNCFPPYIKISHKLPKLDRHWKCTYKIFRIIKPAFTVTRSRMKDFVNSSLLLWTVFIHPFKSTIWLKCALLPQFQYQTNTKTYKILIYLKPRLFFKYICNKVNGRCYL